MKPVDLPPIDLIRWAVDRPYTPDFADLDPAEWRAAMVRARSAIRGARGVVFDADASFKLGQIADLDPEVLLYLLQSARLPWERALLQVNHRALLEGMGRGDKAVDTEYVFLVEQVGGPGRVRISVFVIDRIEARNPIIVPELFGAELDATGERPVRRECRQIDIARDVCREILVKHVRVAVNDKHPEVTPPKVDAIFAEAMIAGRDPTDVILLGQAYVPDIQVNALTGELRVISDDVDVRRDLGSRMALQVSPYAGIVAFKGLSWDARDAAIRGYVGTEIKEVLGFPRTVLAAMIAFGLSGASEVTEARPRGARLVGGRRCPYLATSRVVIDLNRVRREVSERPAGDSGIHKRRHHVRGFWRYYHAYGRGGLPDCAHQWQAAPATAKRAENPDRQCCASCGARRTWIVEHERGDAALGYVHPEKIEVTA